MCGERGLRDRVDCAIAWTPSQFTPDSRVDRSRCGRHRFLLRVRAPSRDLCNGHEGPDVEYLAAREHQDGAALAPDFGEPRPGSDPVIGSVMGSPGRQVGWIRPDRDSRTS